jgi:hypothetical protein
MRNKENGFVLPMILAIMMVIGIFIPALVSWLQQDTKQSVKEAKATAAFNLAEAGIDRGLWKLKSSTATFGQAKIGTVIAGYNFDTTYSDIPGGFYRIHFSSGPSTRDVTITAEGKDMLSQETRAVRAVYRNQTFGGGMISGGVITWANAFSAHWGPIMAHGNINITDANAAQDYFPKKYSRQAVQCTIGSYNRDTNGLALPNTDSLEWWSDYAVPELPILDFAALRSSASTTGTLNVYGCSKMGTWPPTVGDWTGAKWWGKNACNLGSSNHNGLRHFQNSWNNPLARKQYVWYWDEDVIMTGDVGDEGHGIWGNVIARKNVTNYAGDNYTYTGNIPSNAWEQYTKISKSAGDTSAKNEYPGDDGLRKNRSTFNFGSETWTGGKSPPPAGNTDVGFRGLIYIGGNFNIQGPVDVHGVVWVAGNVSKAVGSERTVIFFDETLDIPTLNVVLVRQSWNEIMPSGTAWP